MVLWYLVLIFPGTPCLANWPPFTARANNKLVQWKFPPTSRWPWLCRPHAILWQELVISEPKNADFSALTRRTVVHFPCMTQHMWPGPCKCQNHKFRNQWLRIQPPRLGCTLALSDLDGLPQLCKFQNHACRNPAKLYSEHVLQISQNSNRNQEVQIFEINYNFQRNSYYLILCMY